MITYIPSGTKNLKLIFPALPWADISEYYLKLKDENSAVISTSHKFIIEDCEDNFRIHFLNSLGEFDSLNFKQTEKLHENKSNTYRSGLTGKTDHDISRINIVANDSYAGVIETTEENINYLDELLDTPVAYLEWNDTYMPIVITDKKSPKFKEQERYYYEVYIEFKLSHEKIIIR